MITEAERAGLKNVQPHEMVSKVTEILEKKSKWLIAPELKVKIERMLRAYASEESEKQKEFKSSIKPHFERMPKRIGKENLEEQDRLLRREFRKLSAKIFPKEMDELQQRKHGLQTYLMAQRILKYAAETEPHDVLWSAGLRTAFRQCNSSKNRMFACGMEGCYSIASDGRNLTS